MVAFNGMRMTFDTGPEEVCSTMLHVVGLVGALLFAWFGIWPAYNTMDTIYFASLVVYGVSLIVFFCFSFAFHITNNQNRKMLLMGLDQCGTYLLTAASGTLLIVLLYHPIAWLPLMVIWGTAGLGILARLLIVRDVNILYLLFLIGTIGAIGYYTYALLPLLVVEFLVILSISLVLMLAGLVFYRWVTLPFHHSIWHGFVLISIGMQMYLVQFFIIPSLSMVSPSMAN